MELVSNSKSILSSNDFELNLERGNSLTYNYVYPKDVKIQGIVVIVPGFGDDVSLAYGEKIRCFLAESFSVIAVHVKYHCFYSRLSVGATYGINENDIVNLSKHINMKKHSHLSVESLLGMLDKEIEHKKISGELSKEYKHVQTLTFIPKHNEYQNFGVMQALDHINVINDIKSSKFNFSDSLPVIMVGNSHGGYISYLAVKFAPSLIDYIIDNSSYLEPPHQYITENAQSKGEYEQTYSNNIFLKIKTLTYWSSEKESRFYFSDDHYKIRNILDLEHLKKYDLLSRNKKTVFIAYHSTKDLLVPIEHKINLYKHLTHLGFQTKLNIIDNDSQVDGKFIKTLGHGLGMSLKALMNKELPAILECHVQVNPSPNQDIIYACENISYRFHTVKELYVGEITYTC